MKTYKYYCRLRPPTPGAIPKKGLVEVSNKELIYNNLECYGYCIYDRELTDKEVWEYDLEKPIIWKTKKQAMALYKEFLYEMFNGNEDKITNFINDKEGFEIFMNKQKFQIKY